MLCQLCNEEVKSVKALALHINNKHPETDKEQYFIRFMSINNEHLCLNCGKPNKFRGFAKRCGTYCSTKCMANSKEIQNKRKDTIVDKYGVENISQIVEVKEKKKKINQEKFGVDYYFQSEEGKEKIKDTMIERHGVENPMMLDKFKNKCFRKFSSNIYNKLLNGNRLNQLVKPLFKFEDYKGNKSNKGINEYPFECLKCNTEFLSGIYNGKTPRCLICFPYNTGYSNQEKELLDFVKSLFPETETILENTKSIITPFELDIYIPNYKLAIEFNGLYWHSESQGKDKNYHINKTNLCNSKDITLLHIFEDEWINKKEIVQSVIKSKINLITDRVYARECIIKDVKFKEASEFLDNNHLQGSLNSGKSIGLFYNNELVSVFTYSKSRYDKTYDWELLRYCSKLDLNVVGGFSKLLKHFRKNNIGALLTYSDLRYSIGNVYLKNGFTYLRTSTPNYFYVDDYTHRYSRMKFQKHKLQNLFENYDENLTEFEIMQLNGYDRIWDCGNKTFILK